jgi:hypothetical protein
MGLAAALVGDDACAPWARAGEHAVPARQDYALSASNNGSVAQFKAAVRGAPPEPRRPVCPDRLLPGHDQGARLSLVPRACETGHRPELAAVGAIEHVPGPIFGCPNL